MKGKTKHIKNFQHFTHLDFKENLKIFCKQLQITIIYYFNKNYKLSEQIKNYILF